MTSRATIHTSRGLDRLVNFSDAAVAIAITLLVLPLVDLATSLDDQDLGQLLVENAGSFVAFAVTFAVIARLWLVHHRIFEWVIDYSTALVWLNMLWLASIALLPFAANALSFEQWGDAGVIALYAGTISVTSIAMLAMLAVMRRHPQLVREEMRGRIQFTPSLAVIICLVLVILLAIAVPATGAYALLLLFLTGPIGALLDRVSPRKRTKIDRTSS